mgnify:CR=1 FL=1
MRPNRRPKTLLAAGAVFAGTLLGAACGGESSETTNVYDSYDVRTAGDITAGIGRGAVTLFTIEDGEDRPRKQEIVFAGNITNRPAEAGIEGKEEPDLNDDNVFQNFDMPAGACSIVKASEGELLAFGKNTPRGHVTIAQQDGGTAEICNESGNTALTVTGVFMPAFPELFVDAAVDAHNELHPELADD